MKFLLTLIFSTMLFCTEASALRVGTVTNNPPLASRAGNNHFFGFEIDIMLEICKRLSMNCQFKALTMKDIQAQLMAQKIDVAIATYIISSAPPVGFIYSLPYLASNAEFMVNVESSITTQDQIKDKKVGVRHGTLFDDLLYKMYGDNVTIVKYNIMNELLAALDNNDIDAILTDAVAADDWVITSEGEYRIVGDQIPIGNGYGILANLGQEALIAQINKAIQDMMLDGSYVRIYSSYFD